MALLAKASGCSPYDLARLEDEYPYIFEEYMVLFEKRRQTFLQRRESTRAERVQRMFTRRQR